MSDSVFRILLDLLMVSDPWPLEEASHEKLIKYLDAESKARGFIDWIDAYHEVKP